MWEKGQSGNPGGKNKSEYRKLLEVALAAESKAHKISLLRHAVRRAYEDDSVLIAIVRKLLPDLKAIEANVVQESPFRLIIDLSSKDEKKTS